MGNDWTLRPAAEADLVDIWQSTAARWGMSQAECYVDGVFAVFDLIAGFPDLARERTELSPPVRIHPTGSHLVIYRHGGSGVEVIRILLAHQNLTAYLAET